MQMLQHNKTTAEIFYRMRIYSAPKNAKDSRRAMSNICFSILDSSVYLCKYWHSTITQSSAHCSQCERQAIAGRTQDKQMRRFDIKLHLIIIVY